MRTALIVSLNFRAAHVSHLVASYHQMLDLGFSPILFVSADFVSYLPKGIEYVTSTKELSRYSNIAVSIFWFPSIKNIYLMMCLKIRYRSKIVYVFHEPIEKFSTYLASGNSYCWTIVFFIKYYIGLSFLLIANKVILPSSKAVRLYENGIAHRINGDYVCLPLLYSDERSDVYSRLKREYFSYIGSINKDHAYNNYVDYIYYIFTHDIFPDLNFLIASWRTVPADIRISEMIKSGRLKVVSGKPMTDDEINTYYASSVIVWNAYSRSTQSGVLAKAFMFGTPGIVLRHNLSEFVTDGNEVKAVKSNADFEELNNAVDTISANFDHYSSRARANYERNYNYASHNDTMKDILASINVSAE